MWFTGGPDLELQYVNFQVEKFTNKFDRLLYYLNEVII